jgi:hypothetical protein
MWRCRKPFWELKSIAIYIQFIMRHIWRWYAQVLTVDGPFSTQLVELIVHCCLPVHIVWLV